ncbi:NADPH-dependent FMN reductase [Actinomadura macrotermitis]|uniref:NADPH-dependent FMN reductase-like domain-containing protein n=1 Tax=Actinomadura macrotermitis TaxID=2585200 RepID=A0A7K0C0R3_9ACTN|nr:NADPH-dependent FMN reductase [Actinomadura macrotermitis]MQY06394.1 hypothetical protein [Actinomadura macrotermitis]
MTRIGIIIGSTRPGRRGAAVADWVAAAAARHPAAAAGEAEFALVDLADHDLPLLDEAAPAAFGSYANPHTLRWAETIGSFDGFVFVTPEYNHSLPAALKNAIDYLDAEWANKAAGFVGYGTAGGARAVEHLRQIVGEMRIADVRTQVQLSVYTDFEITDPLETGRFAPGEHQEPLLHAMLTEVIAWSAALAPLRTPQPTAA